MEIGLALVMQVFVDASLTEGHLVGHAEVVDDRIVLVAVKHPRLNGGLGLVVVVLNLFVHAVHLRVTFWQ